MTLIFYSLKNLDPVNACSNPVGHGFNFPCHDKDGSHYICKGLAITFVGFA